MKKKKKERERRRRRKRGRKRGEEEREKRHFAVPVLSSSPVRRLPLVSHDNHQRSDDDSGSKNDGMKRRERERKINDT